MAKTDVIVFNNHGVGQYVRVKNLPKSGETIKGWDWRVEQDGGKGSNVAIALARLNVKTAFIGKVGQDMWGDLGKKWMQDAGVNIRCLHQSTDVTTSTGLIMVDEAGQNSIVIGDSSSNSMHISEIERDIVSLTSARIFVTGFEVREELALASAQTAKKLGMRTILNPSPLPTSNMGLLDYIDIIVINEIEGRSLAEGLNTSARYEEIVSAISERYHTDSVVMTLGAEGCIVLTDGNISRIMPIAQNVVDTTGAGDGFLAAMVANLIWGKTVEQACRWANQYSAYTVACMGTISSFPTLSAAERFIEQIDVCNCP